MLSKKFSDANRASFAAANKGLEDDDDDEEEDASVRGGGKGR